MAVDLEQLIVSTNRIVSFPEVVHRVSRAVDDPHFSLDRIGRMITEDLGLSARLLKLANSPLYRLPHPVSTVTRALTLIGTKQLRDLITASYIVEMFSGVPEQLVQMDSFWRHSIACGVAARVIATARREENVERYYLMGLLHDIGLLVIYTQLPETSLQILTDCRAGKQLLYRLEQQGLGFDHGMVGGRLLQEWNLPADLWGPVLWHHEPTTAKDYLLETAIVHVAESFAATLMLGNSGEYWVVPVDRYAWDRLDLPVTTVPWILQRVERQFQDALGIFCS